MSTICSRALLLEIGKIVMAGVAAAGAIVTGGAIEKALMTIPAFAIAIPMFGSLASILGIFFGALISGLLGALALNLLDRAISGALKREIRNRQSDQQNKLLVHQGLMIDIKAVKTATIRDRAAESISVRHAKASASISESLQTIYKDADCEIANNDEALDQIGQDLGELLK